MILTTEEDRIEHSKSDRGGNGNNPWFWVCPRRGGGGGGDGGIATIIECANGDYARNGEECPSRRDVLRYHGLVEGRAEAEEGRRFSCEFGELTYIDTEFHFGHVCNIEDDRFDPVRNEYRDTQMPVAVSRKSHPTQVSAYAINSPGRAHVECSSERNTPTLYITTDGQNFVEDSCQEDL